MSADASPAGKPADDASPSRGAVMIRFGVLLVLLVGAGFAAWRLGFFDLRDPRHLAAAVRRARGVRAIAPLFVLVYAVVAAFGLPATPFTLAGGAIFGTVLGSILNWSGAVLGAIGSFFLAKVLGHDALRRLLGQKATKLQGLVERGGFATMFRLRLLPVVPFNVLSFAAGLAGMPFRAYVLGTALGIIPGTIVYTYFADSLISGAAGASRAAFLKVGVAAALLLIVSFAPMVVRRLRHQGPDTAGT
jgi:uncharacterized membrane protein YdjX (TVP38/TMEM64 family)